MLGIGAFSCALIMAPVLNLLQEAYGIGSKTLPAPQANLMASVAKGLFGGQLPWTMIAIGGVIGALTIALDGWLKSRGSRFRVPVLAAAIGIYLPLELMVPIFLGGLLAHLVERFHKVRADDEAGLDRVHRPGVLFSAGLITGEALMGIAIALPIVITGTRKYWPCRSASAPRPSGSASRSWPWSAGCCTGSASAANRRPEARGTEGMTFRLCAAPRPAPNIRVCLAGAPDEAPPPFHDSGRSAAAALGLAAASPVEAARGFDVRDLQKLDRVSSPVLSPDGARVVFAKREMLGGNAGDELGKASTSLWIRDLRTRDMAPPKRLTPVGWNVNSPAFSADGQWLYFLSPQSGSQQVYVMPATGGAPKQATHFPLDVGTFKLSPDGRRLAVSMEVFPDCGADLDCTVKRLDQRKASKASGVVYDQLFVRHWDTWEDGRHNRLFVTTPSTGKNPPTVFLVESSVAASGPGNVPSKPFGGNDEYAWSPDGGSIVFAMRRADRKEAWSTDFDLYEYRVGQPLKHLTFDDRTDPKAASPGPQGQNRAWDTGPVFSADGKTLYYRAMKRPGFEADRFGLMARDMATGATREIAPDWDRSADGITLSADGTKIYTTAQDTGEHPLFAVDIATGKVRSWSATAASPRSRSPVTPWCSPATACAAATSCSPLRCRRRRPCVRSPRPPERCCRTWHSATTSSSTSPAGTARPCMATWSSHGITWKGRSTRSRSLIHGGPQGSFGDGWSYRWNPQTYAGQGYAVVMIDFHGSTGYGKAFTDAISGDWGGKPLEDLQKGWAAAQQKYAFLDGGKACALGASYGGYMINWIAGNWFDAKGNAPFKCLVNHDGVFDTRSMGYVTEELWFTEWENRGTPLQNPEGYEKFNPVNHVAQWKVPMLVVQGEKDYRVPVDGACPPSPRCSARASSPSCCTSRTRTTGYSSRPTACSGTTRSTAG